MLYLRSHHQYLVIDKVKQVVGVSYDGHFVYWTNVAMNTESIVKAREDGSKMEVRTYFLFLDRYIPFLLLPLTDFANNWSIVARRHICGLDNWKSLLF